MTTLMGSPQRLAHGFRSGTVAFPGSGVDRILLQELLGRSAIVQKPLEQLVILFNAAVLAGDQQQIEKLGGLIADGIEQDPTAIAPIQAQMQEVAFIKPPPLFADPAVVSARLKAHLDGDQRPKVTPSPRYLLFRTIGSGYFGFVYLAQDLTTGKKVAIKILNDSRTAQEVEKFKRGIEILRKINHPSVVEILDWGEPNEGIMVDDNKQPHRANHYLVMKFVQGITLRDRIYLTGAMSWKEVKKILIPLAEALEVVHAAGFVYRDVNPSNILIHAKKKGYQVTLIDFDLAIPWPNPQEVALEKSMDKIYGSPSFRAPEQTNFQGVDPRTDIYKLGLVLFEMLMGEPLCDLSESAATKIKQHKTGSFPRLQLLHDNPKIPEAVKAIVLKAIARNPEERYPSIAEMIRAIQEAK